MKKLIAIVLLLASTTTFAHGHYRGGWVAPAIIGGAVVYAATRPHYVYAQPLYVQQPVYVQQQQYQPPYGYHYENILDANCNCYRQVLVQN